RGWGRGGLCRGGGKPCGVRGLFEGLRPERGEGRTAMKSQTGGAMIGWTAGLYLLVALPAWAQGIPESFVPPLPSIPKNDQQVSPPPPTEQRGEQLQAPVLAPTPVPVDEGK